MPLVLSLKFNNFNNNNNNKKANVRFKADLKSSDFECRSLTIAKKKILFHRRIFFFVHKTKLIKNEEKKNCSIQRWYTNSKRMSYSMMWSQSYKTKLYETSTYNVRL